MPHGGFGHFGGGWGGGWGGWGGRRIGFPLIGGWGLGGLGGFGGGGLLGDLLSGGVGYMIGKNSAQNQQQYQQYPQYPPQYQQPAPQYQPPAQASTPTGSTQNNRLAQLKLLGQLHDQGVLSDDEFQAEKQRILNGF